MSSPAASPVFAVSIPVRGYADWLEDTLRSLSVQRAGMQVAVLDATPDDSVQRVVDRHRGLVTYGYHHADGGQTAAINEGWRNLGGDVLFWLNADDYLFPWTLEAVAGIFADHPEVDVVYGHSVHVTGDGAFLEYFPSIATDPDGLHRGCCIAQPSCFVRRAAIDRAGYPDPDRHYTMDWDLWCRLLDSGARFRFLDRPLSLVRLHTATKTSSGAARRYAEIGALVGRYHGPAAGAATRAKFLLRDRLPRPVRMALRRLRRRPVLFGLEAGSNRVAGECTIHLVRYDRPSVSLALFTDSPGPHAVDTGAGPATARAGGQASFPTADGSVAAFVHRAPLAPLAAGRAMSARVSHAGGGAWRLFGAVLETAPEPVRAAG